MGNSEMNKDQRGMTYAGLLIILVVIAVFATVLIRIVPLYLENFKITSSLDSLSKDSEVGGMSYDGIRELLMKRLDINDVRRITKKDINVKEAGKNIVVSVEYEARVPLFLNLDLVAKFPNNKVEIAKP